MSKSESHIGGCHMGDVVTFYTQGEERKVMGEVVGLAFGTHQGDYATITLNADGVLYDFGTGGHFGTSWTTEDGSEEWFLEGVL